MIRVDKRRAWEIEHETLSKAVPPEGQQEDRSWEMMAQLEQFQSAQVRLWWDARVPGSGAPEHLAVAAVQALENRGMRVEAWAELIDEGYAAFEAGDDTELIRVHTKLRAALRAAVKDESSAYWRFRRYNSYDEYLRDVDFSAYGADGGGAGNSAGVGAHTVTGRAGGDAAVDIESGDFRDRIYAGWLAQILAGAHGTALEGYTTDRLREAFGEVDGYVYPPSTVNDDITYELALLKAVDAHGPELGSREIALWWNALIPFGWSAEWIALENIAAGVMPPESGRVGNPFSEWIGAQMRGAVCGMLAPADPREAARLAWMDGEISHEGNGILGEIFNALLVSLSFVRRDVRGLVQETASLIPASSEYRSVIDTALEQCRDNDEWEAAWRSCEKKYERYNWVHAYPNAAAEVIALWFGNGDFDETLRIVSMEGQDVDCNAAQIMTVLGVMGKSASIPEKWSRPIGDTLHSYVRSMKELSISELSDWTVEMVRRMKSPRS